MDCEQLAPLYEEYALGVLEGEERAELEAHLARACAQCTPGVEKARWVVAQLAQMAPDAQPPAVAEEENSGCDQVVRQRRRNCQA